MKKGWEKTRLGDAITLEYGKPLDRSERKQDGLYPVYGANGEKERSNKFYVDQPSIIVGRKGSAGELNLTEEKFWPLDVTYFVQFDRTQYDLQFLYHLLTLQNLPDLAKGVKPGINRNDVYAIEVKIPPLPEQQRIVAILDEAFEGIAKAKANAEQNFKNARELFESHLQAVFSQRGEGWAGRTLRQIAVDFGRGKSKHRPRNDPRLYDGPYPFIQTGDVRNSEHLITEFTQTYSEFGLSQSKLWPKGTLCITIAANIAETGILSFDACFPDSVIGIIVDENQSNNAFLEYLLQAAKTFLKAKGKGSAQDNINLGTFENELFFFPSLAIQNEITKILDELSAETQRLESIYQRKIAALDELKKSLLHKAFSGEL